jgi:hypothetical protein
MEAYNRIAMLNPTKLANTLHDAQSQKTDGQGKPLSPATEIQEYASGIVAALKAATFSHLPGTVTGITAPGAPLASGAALGGIIVIQPSALIAKTANGFSPPGPKVSSENIAVIQYIGTGLVNFPVGTITGTCTSTPVSPGPLILGSGSGGSIVGITGAGCVAAVSAATGLAGPDMLNHYNALINYILANAEASYPVGTVTGVCPAGSGPLIGGTATGGLFA